MKQFKHYKDLIRYAVRRAIHRVDHDDPVLNDRLAILGTSVKDEMKKTDWLQWAAQKLKGVG